MVVLKESLTAARDVARLVKKAVVTQVHRGSFETELVGERIRTVYESRKHTGERDYPFLARLADGADCIYDVGANVCLTAILMARRSRGTVVCFEASEEAALIAGKNVELNGLGERIRIVNALVGQRPGEVVEFLWSGHSGGASMHPGVRSHEIRLSKACITIDDYAERIGPLPSLIKVDVEGAEATVLGGAIATLRRAQPSIALELHGYDDLPIVENARRILSLLKQVDYKAIYLRTLEEVHDPQVVGDRGRCHWLLLPRSRPAPTWLGHVCNGL